MLGTRPAEVVIANRTPERAEALAAAFADLGVTQGVAFADRRASALRHHHQCDLRQPQRRHAAHSARARSAPTPSATTWPMGKLATRIRALGAAVAAVHARCRAGACWWSRPRSRSACGAACGRNRTGAAVLGIALPSMTDRARRRAARRQRSAHGDEFLRALVGWIATVSSKSRLVAPMRTATAKPCSISSAPCADDVQADDALLGARR